MINFLKPVILEKGADLTYEERNLLSLAFKNHVSAQRTALRTIGAIEQNPKYNQYTIRLTNFKRKVEEELYQNCDMINQIIKAEILPRADAKPEVKAFFLKMIGDYSRYVAEIARGEKLKVAKQDALKAYKEAKEIAEKDLGACSSIRLGNALNYSVFFYEVMVDCKMAY